MRRIHKLLHIISCTLILLILGWLVFQIGTSYSVSYIDLDDNAGFAEYCGTEHGGMYCRESNHYFTVKEYRWEIKK